MSFILYMIIFVFIHLSLSYWLMSTKLSYYHWVVKHQKFYVCQTLCFWGLGIFGLILAALSGSWPLGLETVIAILFPVFLVLSVLAIGVYSMPLWLFQAFRKSPYTYYVFVFIYGWFGLCYSIFLKAPSLLIFCVAILLIQQLYLSSAALAYKRQKEIESMEDSEL